MRSIHSRNTGPELAIRKLIYGLGYRYRLKGIRLPGKPDVIFTKKEKVIFVHGCFWHQHDDPSCPKAHLPKSKQEYWLPKLVRTIERDEENKAKLEQLGWSTLTLWECEIKDMITTADKVKKFLGP